MTSFDTKHWVLIDTETTGINPPIHVVELAAQRMRGWRPEGPAFRRLLNPGTAVPREASRVHGYTAEILERDGEPPLVVHRAFAEYAGGLPLVAYNLAYDYDEVLLPEWQRLGFAPPNPPGFCALALARRLIDPVPAGNCQLQTLRQFYRLPERGAHTAAGDVQTVVDLIDIVLAPLATARGLCDWAQLLAFTTAPWFPRRLGFGRFKGRDYRDASSDPELRGWLEWLAASGNARSASMGRWYLDQLQQPEPASGWTVVGAAEPAAAVGSGLVIHVDPQLAVLERLVAEARGRLAELEAELTAGRRAVDAVQGRLFVHLRERFQRRDRLRLRVKLRRELLEALLAADEAEAAAAEQAHADARQQSDEAYEQAAAAAVEKQALSEAEAAELKQLWRKLVRLFHPDRVAGDPARRAAHDWLTAEINRARDAGDLNRLRQIAEDPEAVLRERGLGGLDFGEESGVAALRRLYESLQARVLEALEALDALQMEPGYRLHLELGAEPGRFDAVVAAHAEVLEAEIAELSAECGRLGAEIEALTGEPAPGGASS